ncbi:MAG: protein kinase [Myxococcales bacterium]|jgi:serine/threonine protein kinase|nr:protein kinase [Myxococcales bacterium]
MSSPKGGLRPFQPTKFARYTLLQPIAKGGMGEVFLAQMTGAEGFEKLIIIKKILPTLVQEGDFVQRFVAEAKILVQLHHGAIAQIFDMGIENDSYYIAMEFVDGKDLRKLLSRTLEKRSRLPAGLALHIIVRILDALAYAHRKTMNDGAELNLVHRDISPQNILISYEGEVKLIDFGLAKSSTAQQQKTRAGMVVGKIFYMAPEQALHEVVDKRSDLYAAGVCLYEMLAGKNPFDTGASALMLMHQVANPDIPSIRKVRPDLPLALEQLLKKALAPNPDDRFASAEEMRGRLTAIMLDLDPMAGPESLAAYMRRLFEADFANERRHIAAMAKVLPKDTEPPAATPKAEPPKEREKEAAPSASRSAARPMAALGDAAQERSVSGKRPRRLASQDDVPRGRVGRSLEEPSERRRADDTDPSKTPKHLTADHLEVAMSSSGRQRDARVNPSTEKRAAEPKTRIIPLDASKPLSLEEGPRQALETKITLSTNDLDQPVTRRTSVPPAAAKDGGLKVIVIIGVVALLAISAGFAILKRDLDPASLQVAASEPAKSKPALPEPIAPSPQRLARPSATTSTTSAPSAADNNKPRAPDKARATLARHALPPAMSEMTQVFESLTAEFQAFEQAHGCAQLSMTCEFHATLAKQHTSLATNAKQKIPPASYHLDRRKFWDGLKVLDTSLIDLKKKWGEPPPISPESTP